jgi:heterodisulfide reductase subunit A
VGNYTVKVRRKTRYVDEEKCTGCGLCQTKCPWKTDSEFDMGLGKRKAIYMPFPQAIPLVPVIDTDLCVYFQKGKCRVCEKFCEANALDFEQTDRIEEIEVGSIIVATGFETFDAERIPRYSYGRLPNVVTSLELERMVNASGPTGGKIVLEDGSTPERVGIVHCVGSRDVNYNVYCSRVCCMASLKLAHLVREKSGADVYNFYIDMRAGGKGYEEFYRRVMEEGTHVIRGRVAVVSASPQVPEEEGHLIVQVEDTLTAVVRRIPMDMVILAVGMEPREDAEEVARLFKISRSADGFFLEKHPKLDPVATTTDGVFVVGACQGPKDIPDTVAQASAAAARALAMISKGQVVPEAATATVDAALCQGCGRCEEICEFGAPIVTLEDGVPVSSVNEAMCKGCGACAVVCPTGAISVRHFTRDEILAEIDALAGVPA